MSTKRVVISGCSSGLGFAMAQAFLDRDWKVIGLSRNEQNHPIAHKNFMLVTINNESLDFNELQKIMISHLTPGIDLLINNAGFALVGALESLDEKSITQQMTVNFLSHVMITKACLPALRKKKGKILNISSAFGLVGFPLHSLYCASKFALEGFSESLYYELHGQGIQCSVIEPGRYKTQFSHHMQVTPPKESLHATYLDSHHGFLRLKQELSNKAANNIDLFAQKIVQLAQRDKLPIRIPIDLDSRLPYLLKKYLPSRLFAWLQYKMIAKYV
ncbi:SDR family NAD(P)-dependent oxidoreductase [Candidatus Berkiella aquae]|uniref:3-oxoacyl-[acyl-carrier-protein] reductase FabG n=1 Tax=Candidatus Berkiella aquae TaxID=295108 RepID=A0A0Q9Z0F9_9GAMM|nr:SDR family NAD(P)-dependent oxidoreductase [Candidatus Berkiella aquae]MCS5710319.1 SDR family NAD(P)-dependent oxidoreductase [Candidatus Berkiella aquae]